MNDHDTDESHKESSSIPRPTSLLVGPSSQLRAPSSLLSGALPRSLLMNNNNNSPSMNLMFPGSSSSAPTGPLLRPRRLWNVQDNSLKRIPTGYPPLNPRCTVFVGDAPPSIVAVRIAECLRKRSIGVEYDEEMNMATALTVDRCLFHIQLYKGNPEFFIQGVIVECHRVSGPGISFHRACRAVLKAASGQSTGDDTARKPYQCNGREFQHLPDYEPKVGATTTFATETVPSRPQSLLSASSSSSNRPTFPISNEDHVTSKPQAMAAQALEQIMELVHKDRLDTQLLGMERLVDLTSPSISGKEMVIYTSRQLILGDVRWIINQVIRRDDIDSPNVSSLHGRVGIDEGRLVSHIRALSIRVLCNALSIVAQERLLMGIFENSKDHPLTGRVFLECLVDDLEGVHRPPSVVDAGTNALTSIHESALALRILRILGDHSEDVGTFLRSDLVLERLESAQAIGRASHVGLQQEAEMAYRSLTEDVRSC